MKVKNNFKGAVCMREIDVVLLLLSMIFCHIVDDYYLQVGILSNLKQKSWWKDNAPDDMYKNDYIVGLLMHSFSWAFMVMLPISVYMLLHGIELNGNYIIPYLLNMVIHAIVDDLKANKKKLNLMQDQSIHLVQIVITWIIFIFIIK